MIRPAPSGWRERMREDIARHRARSRALGPGIITGGAGDDPAGIVTYTLVGATTGLSQLWLLLLATPMMIAVQGSIARIAIVTGKSLPELTTTFHSRRLTVLMIGVLATANTLTIGADLQALAAILSLLVGPAPVYFLIPVTALIGWRSGMDNRIADAKGFYLVFLGSLLVSDLIDLSPISTVDALYYSQVLDGLLLPVLLLIVLRLANDRRIMGEHVNTRFNNGMALFTLGISLALAGLLIGQWLTAT